MVPVLEGDTPATLHARIQEAERALYPAVIAALARGEITVQGRQTVRAKKSWMRRSAHVSNNYNHTPLNNPLRERVIGRKLRALNDLF